MRIRFRVAAACLLAVSIASGIGAATGARAEGEMTFRAVQIGQQRSCGSECPTIIAATGRITPATSSRFLDFIRQNTNRDDLHAVVFLDSPGGSVVGAMDFGTMLRRVGAAAVVARVYPGGPGGSVMTNAQCFSACVYAFMGARKRVIPAASQIGIHRMFAYEDSVDASGSYIIRRRHYDTGEGRSALMSYSAEMGVDPGLIVAAEHIPSDTLHILSRSEIKRWRLGVPRL